MWFTWEMRSWSTRFGRGNLLSPGMLCNQCIEVTCNEQWFYFVWLSLIFWITLLLIHQDFTPLFFEGHQFPRTACGIDCFPDFPRLLSCHDSTDYPLSTNFSLGRFSKHRALILLRARISSGEFWEFEEII